MFARAVTAITSKAENFVFTTSIPLLNGEKSMRFAAKSTFSSPLDAPVKFKLCLSLSSVDKLVCTLFSNCLLSNRISTTFSSIVVLTIQ